MSGEWPALRAFSELGWSPDREAVLLSTPITAEMVERNLDLLLTTTSYWSSDALDTAGRLLGSATAAVGSQSETGIRLRLHRGVVAGICGAYDDARSALEDTYLDARRNRSPWAAEILANLAALSLHNGDHLSFVRWLATAESTEGSASDVLLASMRTAFLKQRDGWARAKDAMRQQQKSVQQHISLAGPSAPTSLVAVAGVAANNFQAALAEGRTDDAERILEGLELTVQRISALFGADHPQTVTVRLNYATAEFTLARQLGHVERAEVSLTALRSVTEKLATTLAPGHPQTVVAGCTLAAAEFEAARLVRSTSRAVEAYESMTTFVAAITAALGELHPQVLTALVNLATAGFELARAQSTPVQPEAALRTLEDAHRRASTVFGANHGTTRVLQQELSQCQQLVFGVDEDEEGTEGEGSLLTRRKTAAPAPFEPFEQEYISIEQAGEALRPPPPLPPAPPPPSTRREGFFGDILDKVKDLITDDERHDMSQRPKEDPPLTPRCCDGPPGPSWSYVGADEHSPSCPNHPDNVASEERWSS